VAARLHEFELPFPKQQLPAFRRHHLQSICSTTTKRVGNAVRQVACNTQPNMTIC
jgi:hypothetical protein